MGSRDENTCLLKTKVVVALTKLKNQHSLTSSDSLPFLKPANLLVI